MSMFFKKRKKVKSVFSFLTSYFSIAPTALLSAVSHLYTYNGEEDADAGWEVDERTERSRNRFLSSSPAVPPTGPSSPNCFQSPLQIHPPMILAPFKM